MHISAFGAALRTPDLRRKILFTLGLLGLYRLGAVLPTPGVDYAAIQRCIDVVQDNSVYALINLFSGGALLQLSVFALGIMPYITASIILQLLTVVIPRLETLKKDGQAGQAKITQYTRYVTIGLAVLQSTAILSLARTPGALFSGCNETIIPNQGIWVILVMVVVMTAGGMSSIACSSCRSKSSCVNGISVGDKAACSLEGISPASYKIARCAYEPISKPVPCCRSYMKVSMSRMIGHSISPLASAKNGTGPMSFIWCTAGVNGIAAPAISAIRGLQQPQAITTYSVSIVPRSVTTADTRPSVTSISMTSVFGKLVRAFISCAFSRMIVPARSESTTPTDGVQNPPRITSSSR